MITKFEKKVLDFIRNNNLLPQQGNILIAVSGGADSIALMHTLWALKAQGQVNNNLLCAHLNHQLRGKDSDGDEDYVAAQAANLQIRLIKERLDIKRYAQREKLSIETAARSWRIETLQKIAAKNNCSTIVTGHHKDDNAETIIQRLWRGTGFRGLGGIWPKRNFENGVEFVRPLLCVARNEIVDYLNHRGITWRHDDTNDELKYTRNFIRHKLLPELQKNCFFQLTDQLYFLADLTRKVNKKLRTQVESLWQKLADARPDRVVFDLVAFDAQPEPVRVELVRESLIWLGSGEQKLTEQHYLSALELTKQNISNRILELPQGYRAWREYKRIVFACPKPKDLKYQERTKSKLIKIKIPGKTSFGNYSLQAEIEDTGPSTLDELKEKNDSRIEYLDLDRLSLPLTVRFRLQGDKFLPLGAKGEKKVGQFLTNAKVPRELRNKVLVISDTKDIVWIWPLRISEKVKVTDQTSKMLRLRIE